MKQLTFAFLFLFTALFTQSGIAQDEEDSFYAAYGLNIKASGTIPHFLTSKGIRKTFTGVYGFNFSPCFALYKGISIGFDYENGAFTTSANKVSKLNFKEPVMQNNNLGAVIGYEHYSSETTLWSFSVEAGKTWVHYKNLSCAPSDSLNTVHSFNALYIKPETSVYFFIEKNFAIGLNFSYHFVSQSFDPDLACLRTYRDYTEKELSGPISYFNFGFGLYVGLAKKKK